MEKLIATNDRIQVQVLVGPQKQNKMKTFETKEFLNELDRIGVVYTIDYNPSPEKIERIKKSIERRDERLKQMVEDYRSGRFDEIIKSL